MSTKNSIFKDYIQDYKNKWEDDDAMITSVYLIAKSKSKYANMVKSKDWGRNDPSNAQLIALMTKFSGNSSNNSNKRGNTNNKTKPNDSKKSNTTKNSPINPERLVFKGAKATIDGKEMWWCKHHICPRGTYNGMYVMHPPEKHYEWQARKDEFKANRKNKGENKSESNSKDSTVKSFKITDQLRTALCTQDQMSAETIDKILSGDF